MEYRSFGSTGLKVSEIGLGCSNLGGGVFGSDGHESIRLLDRAFDLGINFFDTSNTYGYGRSEELIGTAFRARRDRVIIASKAGMLPSSLGRVGKLFQPILRPVNGFLKPWRRTLKSASSVRQNFSPTHIQKSVEGSLRRLRTDYLDLLQLHNPPIEVMEQQDVFETLDRLSRRGEIRYYGVSARTIQDAFIWLECPNVSTIQIPFNLLELDGSRDLFHARHPKGLR
jgi:aryl-alcohol dehydrogenase-like predicted oxidoreductase